MAGPGKPGRHPLPLQTVIECRRLLAQGLSERDIVQQLSISKGTVYAIRHGKYLKPPPRPRQERLQKPVRCGGCGSLLEYVPCVMCSLRKTVPAATAAPSRFLRPPTPPAAPVQVSNG